MERAINTRLEREELFDSSIRTGLQIEIMRNFPGEAIFRERIPAYNSTFPSWFIQQLTLNINEDRRNFYFLDYLMTLIYRVGAETPLIPNLQNQLDITSFRLMQINKIWFGRFPIPILNARTEKVDGTLHYFCNFNIHVTKPLEDEALQMQLTIYNDIKGGTYL